MTPELSTLRRSVEHDRYGLMAYVLSARDRCQPGQCAAYQSLTDHNQIAANMDERIYEGLILRYFGVVECAGNACACGAPRPPRALPPSLPTGKPTNADFPSAASTPPVNIMTPEPPLARRTCRAASSAGGSQCAGTCAASVTGIDRGQKAGSAEGEDGCAGSTCASSRGPRPLVPLPRPTTDPSKGRRRKLTCNHAAPSHQACRRLRLP